MAEQGICNAQAGGSSPLLGSIFSYMWQSGQLKIWLILLWCDKIILWLKGGVTLKKRFGKENW